MEQFKITGITDKHFPDLLITNIKSGIELILDPFVGCAFIIPDGITDYREYITKNYVGKIIELDTNCQVSFSGEIFIPKENEVKIL